MDALARPCPRCKHPLSDHRGPGANGVYWSCGHWIGHPWDGECDCRQDQLLTPQEQDAWRERETREWAERAELTEYIRRTGSSAGFTPSAKPEQD